MNDNTPTHILTITMTGIYAHGKEHEHATVKIAGDGSLDHAVDAFRAALVAMGFSAGVAERLDVRED